MIIPPPMPGRRAFNLLEVMIAIAVFFVGAFAILSLVSASLANVNRIRRPSVDASPVLATWAATNKLVEGQYHGSLGDENMLGKGYRDYNWVADIQEIRSNHLYLVDCKIVMANGRADMISHMTTVLYRPQSPAGTLDGGIGINK
jgi:hypothetical protein